MLKTSVLRRAIVVHQLNELERDAGRAQAQTIAHGECRAAGDTFFVYVRTVGTVIFDHDGAVAPHDRAMRARYARRCARQCQRARAEFRPTSRSPAAGRKCATRGPGTARAWAAAAQASPRGCRSRFAARGPLQWAADRRARASRRTAGSRLRTAARRARRRLAAARESRSRAAYRSARASPATLRYAARDAQIDRHAGDARALHQAQQLDIVRLGRSDQLRAFELDFQRAVAELHATRDRARCSRELRRATRGN